MYNVYIYCKCFVSSSQICMHCGSGSSSSGGSSSRTHFYSCMYMLLVVVVTCINDICVCMYVESIQIKVASI